MVIVILSDRSEPGSPRTGLRPWGGVPGSPRTGHRPLGGDASLLGAWDTTNPLRAKSERLPHRRWRAAFLPGRPVPGNFARGSIAIQFGHFVRQSIFFSNRIFVGNGQIRLYNRREETHGRRYSTYVQRLRAGLYLHRCGSDVLSGTWLFDPKALQELPSGKEERSGRLRLPFGSVTGYACDLFRLRPAHNSAF